MFFFQVNANQVNVSVHHPSGSSFKTLYFLFQMVFYVSSRVTLLFDFWDVNGLVGKCVKSHRVH